MPKQLEIHPSIGIARVGDSEEIYVQARGINFRYRDASGKLKRRAAQFFIFECERDAQGKLLSAKEITASNAKIKWTVHLANRKAAAPKFTAPAVKRNPNIPEAQLVIDPGPRSIPGLANQAPVKFDTGKFKTTTVKLGDIRTDVDGRLLVAGGFGKSASPSGLAIGDFADNKDWYDDVSDGSIKATVTLNGTVQAVEAVPAWVIVGPPDFAPPIANVVTLYDVAYQVAVEKGLLAAPIKPSFVRDIQPILMAASGYPWVINLAGPGHGSGAPGNFAAMLPQLSNPLTSGPIAQNILQRLRDPNNPGGNNPPGAMPKLNGDDETGKVLMFTKTQYANLKKWSVGNYVNDLNQTPPVELLPDALDRAGLQACAGGGFFPGIEAGRIMRKPEIYSAPFRLNAATLKPGEVTANSALPWQADFFACQRGTLGWWPAQRPDDVFPNATAAAQVSWARGVSGMQEMVSEWKQLGVVIKKGAKYIETERTLLDIGA